ncbi:DUF2523 family protein [Aeromonas veronii]|uniref:DUF2523 family protein n=1 Tax=Aeromonas veronii TaxID=654 RepID=UPI000CD4363F|nr:DUF2523 family protein [Aeromonas veronii]MCF5838640.1 DUF2523 domain-containing protein [Aeromonas veronii]MCS3833236.1 hypothetical protein [Aeromonas veronii]MCX9112738.1 DUF2523 domain-containing protein [Aeromonas veronii]POG20164.1 accessory cholera enterotoxin [Aeromonas veronii]PSJ85484.1 DUF2523 domain-containing protein [Aeromonas veronii]
MEWLGEFFNSFFNDIYQLAVQFGAWLAVKMIVSWVEFKLFLLTFSWDVAKQILVNIHFSELISQSFNSLPADMRGILLYLHLDKGLTILSQAFVTRFLLNMMGW